MNGTGKRARWLKKKKNQGALSSAAFSFSLILTSGRINIITGLMYTVVCLFVCFLFNGILPVKIQIHFFNDIPSYHTNF